PPQHRTERAGTRPTTAPSAREPAPAPHRARGNPPHHRTGRTVWRPVTSERDHHPTSRARTTASLPPAQTGRRRPALLAGRAPARAGAPQRHLRVAAAG